MANPQTWKDPNTGEEYELVADTAPRQTSWKDPKTGEEYELVPDENAPKVETPKVSMPPRYLPANANVSGVADNPVVEQMSLAKRNNLGASAYLQDLWNKGERDPEVFNQAVKTKFPGFSDKMMTAEDIATLRSRDAWYKARGEKNPGNFLFTEDTGIEDPKAPDTIIGSAVQGAKRSLENMANTVTGLGALATDVVGADETSDKLLQKYIEDQKKIEFNNPAAVKRAGDIESVSDAAMYGADVLGELVPQMTSSLGAGAIGSAVGKRAAAKLLADATEEQVAKYGLRGMVAGTLANSSGQETGSIYGDTYAQTGEKAPLMSVVAGLTAGALDSITPIRALTRLGVPTEVITGKIASRMLQAGVKDFAIEGGTEAAQTFIEGLPKSVLTGESPFTPEMLDNMVEAFVRGGIGGGVVGSVSEYLRPEEAAAQNIPPTAPPVAEQQQAPVEQPAAEDTVEDDSPLPFEAPDFLKQPAKGRAKPVEAAPSKSVETTAPAPAVTKEQAADHINDVLASDWKNAPEITTVDNIDQLPDHIREEIIQDGAEDAKGIMRDGKVYILAHNLKSLDDLAGVTYHEALGHVGLARQFGERLNAVLEQIYNTNKMVKEAADGWLKSNTTQSTNPVAHAVEEVLAETNEGGRIDAKVMDKIKAFLKAYARRVPGLKNLKYTDAEVFAILSMAQNKVVKGKSTFFGTSGNKYSLPKAANDDRLGLGDRPDMPYKPTREQQIQYYKDMAQYSRRRAIQAENDGNIRKATRYEIDALTNQNLANKMEGKATPKDNAEYHRKKAEIFEDKARAAFNRGSAKIGRSWQIAAAEERAKAAKQAEQAMSNKYSKPEEGERVRGLNPKYNKGKNPTYSEKFIRELSKDLPEKYVQTWEETEELASKIGMNVKKLEELRKGPKAEDIEAGRQLTLGRLNLIESLQDKIDRGVATEREKDQFAIALRQFVDMFEVMDEVATTAGRNLNILRKMAVNNKAAVNNIRYALQQAGENGLDPARAKIVMDALDELKKNPKAKHHDGYSKAERYLVDIINIPRTLMSSIDLSAPLRQGLVLISRKEFWKSFIKMFHFFVSEKAYKSMLSEIQSRPTFKAMEDAKLFIADIDNELNAREEAFLSKIAGKIPGVRASERAYNGFLNKLRADVFDSIYKNSQRAGLKLEDGSKELNDIARFINNATGRGTIKHFDQSMPILSAMFFSPRLIASRLQMLNPLFYAKLSPVVRKEAMRSAISLAAIVMIVAGLAEANGADVEKDPRSSDFMKIKFGNTRYDIAGGFGQYITLGVRLLTNEKKKASGQIEQYGAKFGQETRLDVTEKFFENKFSPVASFVADALRGKNAVGEDFDTGTAIKTRMIPLYLQDAYEIMQEDSSLTGAAKAAPGLFGVGMQTYSDDRGGAAINDRSTDDPAFKEIQRIGGNDNIITTGSKDDAKSLGIPELDEAQLKQYRNYSAQLISGAVKEAMATPEWKQATDEEKKKWLKTIGKDMRKMAREDLFGTPDEGAEEEVQPGNEYNDEK